MTTSQPILELQAVSRVFTAGEQRILALRDIDLCIAAGEFLAIAGASGCGKSTLMNILGCLDRASSGSYRVDSRDTVGLDRDELAWLRREYFGFVFQRYHLLPQLTAEANVEVPAIYAGTGSLDRQRRARELLVRLGLGERLGHRPHELSGGQQQRVSIARALMNGGAIILADEPTGALDSKTGQEVMDILLELNALGHTIVIATHDLHVAAHARRIVELHDGAMVRNERNADATVHRAADRTDVALRRPTRAGASGTWERLREALRMAWVALLANRLRTALTMLGIIIGITSVVSIVALGEGAQRKVMEELRAFGTNAIEIFPGKDWGDTAAANIQTLKSTDIDALRQQHYVHSVSPVMRSPTLLRYRNVDVTAIVYGVGEDFFEVRGMSIAAGVPFRETEIRRQAQVAVIDANTKQKLFGMKGALGQVIYVGKLPCRVIGVIRNDPLAMLMGLNNLNVWLPYTAVGARILGRQHFDEIVVRIRDGQPSSIAQESLVKLMTRRHGTKDFFTANLDAMAKREEAVVQTVSLLLSFIGFIALLVGGIGVMNIMLVSVSERTREIGIRTAIGARYMDLLQQFLVEAVLVCLLGGTVGLILCYFLSTLLALILPEWPLTLSTGAFVAAFLCATLTGVLFGYLPARNAARLDPVEALARE